MRRFALIALLTALLQNAGAQRMGAAPHFAHFGSQHSAFGSRSFAYPIPFFSDSLYSDVVYPSGYASPQPTVIVMQTPPAADPQPVQPPAQPLLIELQGGHYVRLSGEGNSGAEIIDGDATHGNSYERRPVAGSYTTQRQIATEASPTMLVFRDGHREEVQAYTITGGVLYATGNYYADGSWNRKVELSSLNLCETVAANQSRGVKFQLPLAPNEVIVGP
jgi:hypothetical protein